MFAAERAASIQTFLKVSKTMTNIAKNKWKTEHWDGETFLFNDITEYL